MGIMNFIKKKQATKSQEYITKDELVKLKEIYNNVSDKTNDLESLFQSLENNKAKIEHREPAIVEIVPSANMSIRENDEYDPHTNVITIHFPNRNSPEQLYASFIHESNHANQKHLREQNLNGLSEFDKVSHRTLMALVVS